MGQIFVAMLVGVC